MQTSFWEQDAMTGADFIVIGAGLIGLQLALNLKKRAPRASVMVLERGPLPLGASSRNAGFACFGSLTEILADIRSMGRQAALELVDQRRQGLSRLRALLGDEAIGYEHAGGHELILHGQQQVLQELDETNALLQPLFGAPVFYEKKDAARQAGFGGAIHAVLANDFEGQLHSGRTLRVLRSQAAAAGVEILDGIEVTRLLEEDRQMLLETRAGPRFCARQVAVCTNACIAQLLPEISVVPARGQVVLTTPIPDLPWRGAWHMDEGYWYFRNVGQRVLLGGGRHLAFDAERTLELSTTSLIQEALERLLTQSILPGRDFGIEHRWAGTMGFSADKKPVVRRTSERTLVAFGCNGMGVALSPIVAQQTSDLLLA